MLNCICLFLLTLLSREAVRNKKQGDSVLKKGRISHYKRNHRQPYYCNRHNNDKIVGPRKSCGISTYNLELKKVTFLLLEKREHSL